MGRAAREEAAGKAAGSGRGEAQEGSAGKVGSEGGTRCRAEQMKLYKRQSTKFIALAQNKKMLQHTSDNKKSNTITA